MIENVAEKAMDYVTAFAGALVLTLLLVPPVRALNRRLGMVDMPDARRINKVPVPRGGGLALFLGVAVSYSVFAVVTGRPPLQGDEAAPGLYWRLVAISAWIVALGYADDKFSLPPVAKLAGQLVAAFATWSWAGLGFSGLWPSVPAWLDCALTVFWIVGAVNAFNLIDGLDGLATGIALIATLGMAGTLFIVENPQAALFHFAFAGGLAGFLRYNYNPASVFLGDSGSMYIGYTLAALPLVSQTANSALVSVGVPLLAMGVPIFDTSLAIVRRLIRRLIQRRGDAESGNSRVMTADSDHLHHRILRAVGLSQRKTAWILYALTAAAVGVGLLATALESRAAGLWLVAVAFASVVVFRNMARIELYDAGRLLNAYARDTTAKARRKIARLAVPIYVACDLAVLVAANLVAAEWAGVATGRGLMRYSLLLRVSASFAVLSFAGAYTTIWPRAMLSNFLRLVAACFLGAAASGGAVYFLFPQLSQWAVEVSVMFAFLSAAGLSAVRLFRPVVRDLFYALDCSRLKGRRDVSRVLVYGAGLRYRTFRRELVRTTSANERIIVGLMDDDILLRGHYIGGIRVEGTLRDAQEVVNRLNVDSVVIACVVSDEWLKVIRQTFAPLGVKLTLFSFAETPVPLQEA